LRKSLYDYDVEKAALTYLRNDTRERHRA
jgi:hypothetical protein